MPQSLVFALIHIIFSTKGRTPSITNPTDLHAYLATVARNNGCERYGVDYDEQYLWD